MVIAEASLLSTKNWVWEMDQWRGGQKWEGEGESDQNALYISMRLPRKRNKTHKSSLAQMPADRSICRRGV